MPRSITQVRLALAQLRFDLFQESFQGGGVGGVAGHDLIGQREALRRDDQGDDHLHAVRPLVAAVAELAQARRRWIALEIGAGQVVEQNIEADGEEAVPTLLQHLEERTLVDQQLVQAAVELVDLDHAEVLAQEIAHGTVFEPLAMQPPLAARIEQPVEDQGLEYVQPARPPPPSHYGMHTSRGGAIRLEPLPLRATVCTHL
jgi:hypothetical protein